VIDHRKKILLVKNRALGDAILTLSSIRYLHSVLPHLEISLAVPAWTVPVFKELDHPLVSIYPLQLNSLAGQLDFYSYLLNEKFDLLYEFQQRPSSARLLTLFSKVRSTPYLFHNHHQQQERKSILKRDVGGLIRALKLEGKELAPLPPLQEVTKRQIVLGVVATRKSKMWPLRRFSELVRAIKQLDQNIEILIPLGPQDGELKQQLASDLDVKVHFLETSLDQVAQQIKGSICYIGNDTGLKHLAAYLGVKTISFFGPEEPLEWHPYSQQDHPYLFLADMPCRYKQAHFCGLSECSTMECMAFSVEEVMKLVSPSTHQA
jgi:heptosyltransferase-2